VKKKCLICSSPFLDFLDLGKHPCADTFLFSRTNSLKLKKISLKVGFCKCSHLTLIYPVDSYERYQKFDYSYTSDNSPVSRNHFKKIAQIIYRNYRIDKNSFIVEAGSNDGTFLKEIKAIARCKVLGVEPSKNMCLIARKKGLMIDNNFFNILTSNKIIKKFGNADVLYAANVFNHVDDNLNFLDSARNILKPSGILILEVPDLDSLIEQVGFDTIYHEHRHYYSKKSIAKILYLKNFKIEKICKINYMSGSLRVFASKSTKKFVQVKFSSNISLKTFRRFKKKVSTVIEEIKRFIDLSLSKGERIYGIGAATKGNTLLNCCGLDYKKIKFILDTSVYKIGKYTPGSGIKIVNEKSIKKIEKAIILPWNITDHLVKKLFKNKNNSYISIPKILKSIKCTKN
jgi:SAM-dependent methyltransferase